MLKEITIGQFLPGDSVIHRLDPRIKILLAVAQLVLVFLIQSLYGFAVFFVYIIATTLVARVPVAYLLKGLKPMLFVLTFTFIINIFFYAKGETLFEWWVIKITDDGLKTAVFMAVRLVLLVVSTSLLTLTTSPLKLTDGIERLLSPLKVIRFPAHEIAMMMSIALRFIPTLMEEANKIMNAQKARGADFDTGGLIKRAKSLIPLLVPLFLSAFRRADELALAMESRCYRGGEGRTRMSVLRYALRDLWAVLVVAALYLLILLWGI
jgi:energy-coupling factor transport system permease protein